MKQKIIFPPNLFGRKKTSDELFEEIQSAFLIKIENTLKAKGMSKSRLAMKLGISRSAMSKLLSKEANLTLRKISEIATALNIEIKFMFETHQENQANYHIKIQD
jgi:transcriptional regulator with XRE-family HTH domain